MGRRHDAWQTRGPSRARARSALWFYHGKSQFGECACCDLPTAAGAAIFVWHILNVFPKTRTGGVSGGGVPAERLQQALRRVHRPVLLHRRRCARRAVEGWLERLFAFVEVASYAQASSMEAHSRPPQLESIDSEVQSLVCMRIRIRLRIGPAGRVCEQGQPSIARNAAPFACSLAGNKQVQIRRMHRKDAGKSMP